MDHVDFPGIIAAAAVSTLGVLSLIVLGIGLLAWAFFKGSGDGVKIGVFAAILLAAIGFGAATVRESRGNGTGDDRTGQGGTGTGGTGSGGTAGSSGTGSPATSGTPSDAGAEDARSPFPLPGHSPTNAAADPDASDDAGLDPVTIWQDTEGYTYEVTARGNATSTRIYSGMTQVGSAIGTLSGARVQFHFVNDLEFNEGDCSGAIAPDGASMSGTCSSQRGAFAFHAQRRR